MRCITPSWLSVHPQGHSADLAWRVQPRNAI
nr:MAG TPA: hypothetical protein [Caudoviricetes sp.]